jgi:hypothetical protein
MDTTYSRRRDVDAKVNGLPTSRLKVIKKTIGAIGVKGCDFNFATSSGHSEQVIDICSLPKKAFIQTVWTFTKVAFATVSNFVAEIGTTSSGAQLVSSATIKAAEAVTSTQYTIPLEVDPVNSVVHIYVSADPDGAWSGITSGIMEVYVAYIDVTGL